jgi:hypothetical protein
LTKTLPKATQRAHRNTDPKLEIFLNRSEKFFQIVGIMLKVQAEEPSHEEAEAGTVADKGAEQTKQVKEANSGEEEDATEEYIKRVPGEC